MADSEFNEQIKLNKLLILSFSLEITNFKDRLLFSSSVGIKSKTVGLITRVYFGISISEVAETKTRLFSFDNLLIIKDICS